MVGNPVVAGLSRELGSHTSKPNPHITPSFHLPYFPGRDVCGENQRREVVFIGKVVLGKIWAKMAPAK